MSAERTPGSGLWSPWWLGVYTIIRRPAPIAHEGGVMSHDTPSVMNIFGRALFLLEAELDGKQNRNGLMVVSHLDGLNDGPYFSDCGDGTLVQKGVAGRFVDRDALN